MLEFVSVGGSLFEWLVMVIWFLLVARVWVIVSLILWLLFVMSMLWLGIGVFLVVVEVMCGCYWLFMGIF